MNETPAPPRTPQSLRRLTSWLAALSLVVVLWLAINAVTAGREVAPDDETPVAGGLRVNVEDGQVFTEPVVNLAGTAPPDRLIFINGQPVPVGSDGAFELTLQLAEGPNLILIEAQGADGGTTSLVRQVVYSVPGEAGEAEEAGPPAGRQPEISTGLLALALGVILLAVVITLIRRRRPWVNLTTDAPALRPGPKGTGPVVTLIVELDRAARISLYLLDARGRTVATLLNNRRRGAGRLTFPFDGYSAGEPVPAGEYRVRVEAGVPLFRSVAETALLVNGPGGEPIF
ncbi:MAG TPA: hypothetical protein VMN57_15245 [Anaerolineales bacterium]|nr:hypothetical protein [Anaerolineales bacterium]